MELVICPDCSSEMKILVGTGIKTIHEDSGIDAQSTYVIYECKCGNVQYLKKENIKV